MFAAGAFVVDDARRLRLLQALEPSDRVRLLSVVRRHVLLHAHM